MNATTTTALIGLCTAALVLGFQRHQVTTLEQRGEKLRSEIAGMEGPGDLGRTPRPSILTAPKDSGAGRSAGQPGSSPPMVEVEVVHARLKEWLGTKNFESPRPKEIVANISELLELVADCKGEDLQKLVELLGGVKDQQSGNGMVAVIIQMLAVEYDPLRYLDPDPANTSQMEVEMQSAALSALARQNPRGAMSWLLENSAKIDDRLAGSAYAAVSAQALRRDVDSAVQFLSQLKADDRERTLNRLTIPGIRQSREMIAAARKLPDQATAGDFLQAGVASIMTHEGIEAGRAILETMADAAGYAQIVDHAATLAVESRPDETMAWLMEGEPGSAESTAVPGAITMWAQRDYKAAANWLTAQEASSNRDLAIQSFAKTIKRMDPEAATIWANEITDPGVRAQVLQENFGFWKSKDPEAAAAWKAKQ